ncbi:MAG: TIR domain-containing protein [Flavobacteriia bacterium]|nr:TIR domain-containing protein [Flavobacteriia bacterium]
MQSPKVFISYSWDDEDHKAWVLNLSNSLISNYGCDVILDQYELAAGKNLTGFMERSLEQSDKVIVILSPNYRAKATDAKGGVGYEYSIISSQIFDTQTDHKFIPVLRTGSKEISAPPYLSSLVYHDMTDNSKLLADIEELARQIWNKPKLVKPALGPEPDFDNTIIDPVEARLVSIEKEKKANQKLNSILKSEEGVALANANHSRIIKSLEQKAEKYNQASSYRFNIQSDQRTLILSSSGFSVSIFWTNRYTNSLDDTYLHLRFFSGTVILNESFYFPDNQPVQKLYSQYQFDFDKNGLEGWRNIKSKEDFISEEKLVSHAFSMILNSIESKERKGFR